MSSDSSDIDLDEIDAALDLMDGNVVSMQSLLELFGASLEGNKFKTEKGDSYTINFKWRDCGEDSSSPSQLRDRSIPEGMVKIRGNSGENLKDYFDNKTSSHIYKRTDTMLKMLPEQSSIKITNRELKKVIKVIKDDSQNRTHLVFCFASPLKPPPSSKSRSDLPLLNFNSEIRGIQGAITKIGKSIRYCKKVATAANFGEMVASNPSVLHFSGHGVKVHSNLKCNGDFESGGEGDYLVIEDKF